MPRKTKKTSTDKPEGIELRKDLSCCALMFGAIGAVILVLSTINYVFCSVPIPKYGNCYVHREDPLRVARVRVVGSDFGKYTEVKYSTMSEGFGFLSEAEDNVRSAESFNNIYKKSETCDRVRRIELEQEVTKLELQIESFRASSKHACKK